MLLYKFVTLQLYTYDCHVLAIICNCGSIKNDGEIGCNGNKHSGSMTQEWCDIHKFGLLMCQMLIHCFVSGMFIL